MFRNIAYWGATGLVATVALAGGLSYLSATPESIENFRHVGYPQQLRVLLGIAKVVGAIVLLLPCQPSRNGLTQGLPSRGSRQPSRTIWPTTACFCCRSRCSRR
jgi:hypothetical protein